METIMFVPHTPNGELAQFLQEADDRFTKGKDMGRVKMVERGGTTLKDVLCRTNPWASEGCGRGEECFPCRSGKAGRCQQEGVVYRIKCQECAGRGVSTEYLGETSRTGFLRGGEHLDDLRCRRNKSPLWKHCMDQHEGKEVGFSMEILRRHKSPLTRQIHESVAIENSSARFLMNSKSEYNGSKIPRLVVEVGDQVDTEDWQGQDREKKESSQKEGKWRINNLKKRKRKVDEDQEINTECGPAQPVIEAATRTENVAEERNSRKKMRLATDECGPARLVDRQSVEIIDVTDIARPGDGQSVENAEIGGRDDIQSAECGPAQASAEQSVAECHITKLDNAEDNHMLCQALDTLEICYDIARMLVAKIGETEHPCQVEPKSRPSVPSSAAVDSNTDANRATMKRKMCEGSQNQPSLQPRRRRKKEEISAEVSNKVVEGLEVVAKPSKMNTSQENKNENFISIFKSIPTLKGGKTKTNRRRASTQKSKITNFFQTYPN